MKTSFFLTLPAAAVLSAHGAEAWSSLDGIIPELKMGKTSITRIDYSSGGALITNGGPSASAVQSVLGSLDAGWYSGNKNRDTGTLASVTADGATNLISANGAGGGFTAVKFHELSSNAISGYEALRISFDTGGLFETNRTGQPQISACGTVWEEREILFSRLGLRFPVRRETSATNPIAGQFPKTITAICLTREPLFIW